MVMNEIAIELSSDPLERETAGLGKRFARVKAELKELAKRDGLLKR